jgi:hypothetical protein
MAPCENYMYCETNKQQNINIWAKHNTTYLDIINKPLGSAIYPCRLLGLGDFFVTDKMVPTLAPHVNVFTTIIRAPLDLVHFIVGGRRGFLALSATSGRGNRY